jgi:RNA polymerase sigma-70 factor (ECF subfamily)
MPDSVHTTQLHQWLDRMRGGDEAAREDLCRSLAGRLERLARKMHGQFPRVHRWVDTDDVLQNAVMRLLRALREVRPGSMREFFALAAEQMRRELLDLARHYRRAALEVRHSDDSGAAPDPSDAAAKNPDLEKWATFHEAVARLPAEEREVVGLIFYHGWTQAQVAELFQVAPRTVRRWWVSSQLALQQRLKEC